MKKFTIQVIALIAVILVAFYLYSGQGSIAPFLQFAAVPSQQIKINEALILVEVADNSNSRSRGLSGREKLEPSQGMLFVFEAPKKYQFWMKDMKFALDFIFIQDGLVVDILKNVTPPRAGIDQSQLPIYEPVVPISMLLEVNAGFADSNGIKVGDRVYEVK